MRKILVVDDSTIARLLARSTFEQQGYEVMEADNGIAGLEGYYRDYYPEFYAEPANQEALQNAIEALQDAYSQSVFPEQKADWNSHVSNIGHQNSPGCFRCHDGKHLNDANEAVRLEWHKLHVR